jgi:hypothetical protein
MFGRMGIRKIHGKSALSFIKTLQRFKSLINGFFEKLGWVSNFMHDPIL